MADVIAREVKEYEVVLSEEEAKAIHNFIMGYGQVKPDDMIEWAKTDGATLWHETAAILRDMRCGGVPVTYDSGHTWERKK